ncbi:MAG: DUF5696 domain-containing protein, partial [Verrucomicrobiota bacterium]
MEIGKTEVVTKFDTPVLIPVIIENLSNDAISGTVTIGGPTSGIYPLAEPSQEFTLDAGASVTTTFPVAFDSTCSNAWYPIHCFVELSSGRDFRKQTASLLKTEFADAEPWAGRNPEIVEFQDQRQRNPIGAFLTTQRINTLAEFIRETVDLNHHQAFRLGNDLDSFAVLLLPGKNGLLDGMISFIGPNRELSFQGIQLGIETPIGVDAGAPIEVDEFHSTTVENGIDVAHRIRIDDFATNVTIEVRMLAGGIKLRALSPDSISQFGLGKASRKPIGLTAGLGYRFQDLGTWTLGKDSPLLAASHVGFEFENGMSLLQASSAPLELIEVSPEQSLARIATRGDTWLTLIPSEVSVFDAAARYRAFDVREPAPGVRNVAGRLMINSSQTHFADLADRVKELQRYGVDNAALVVRNWQKHGPGKRLPDVWPPNEELGDLTDLQILAKQCRENQMMWGLEDSYSSIDPLSKEFDYSSVAFGPEGTPAQLRSKPGDDISFAMRPDRVEPYLSRNLKLIRYYLTPTLFVMNGADSVREPFFDRHGKRYNGSFSEQTWRQTISYVQSYLGPTSASITKGGGDWLVGSADGAGFDILSDDLPGPAQRVPWFSLVHHDRLPVYEIQSHSELDSGAGVTLLGEVTEGRLPVVDDRSWGHGMVRKAWLMQPVAEELAYSTVKRVSLLEEDARRMRCLWGENGLLWINASNEGWRVSGREVAPGGFLLRSDNVSASIELRDGVYCEQNTSPLGWYVNARPRHWSLLRIQPSLAEVSVADGQALITLAWKCEETFPPDTELLVQIHNPDNPAVVWQEEVLAPSEATSTWIGQKQVQIPMNLASLPSVRAELSVVARLPNGRPLQMLAKPLKAGRYGHFAAHLGSVSLGFDGNGQLAGIEATPTEWKGLDPDTANQVNVSLRPIDF